MADREFTDKGRPDLFDEEGEFLGSAADYDGYKCRVCGDEFNGISAEDAADEHDTWGLDHEFELDTRCTDCGDETDEGECPNGCHEV